MNASNNGQGPAAVRFAPYIEELQEFFASSCLRYGTPEDILDLTERVDSSSAFAEDLSSMVRSIVLREGGALPHSQLLEILAIAIGGPRMDHAAQQFSQPLRYLLSFIGGVLRRAWNEPPGELRRAAEDRANHHARPHQAEIVPFPIRPKSGSERFGSQAAAISAAAERAAQEGEGGNRFSDADGRFGEVNESFAEADRSGEDSFDPNERFASAAEAYDEESMEQESMEDDGEFGEAPGPQFVWPDPVAASGQLSDSQYRSEEQLRHKHKVPDRIGEPMPAESSASDPESPAREAIEDTDQSGEDAESPHPATVAGSADHAEGRSAAAQFVSDSAGVPSWQVAAQAVRSGTVIPAISPVAATGAKPALPNSARPAPSFEAPVSALEPARNQPVAPPFMHSATRPASELHPEIPPPHILAPSFTPRLPRSPAGILVAGAAMLVVAGIVAASVNRTTELVGKDLPASQAASQAVASAATLSAATTASSKPSAIVQAASAAPAPRTRHVISPAEDDEDDRDVAPPYSTPVPGAPAVSQETSPKSGPYVAQSVAATPITRPPSNEVASTGPIPAPPGVTSGHEYSQSYVGSSPAALRTYRDPDSAIAGDFRGTRPAVEERIRNVDVSSGMMGGNLISAPTPEYPTLARLAHVSGEVVIQAVVAKNGTVLATHVMRGNRLLRGAAQDAVRRWRFKPYVMDGHPVEISTIVTVRFKPHG